jgi:hypothetical protein
MRSLDSISFDAHDFQLAGEQGGARIWKTRAGEVIFMQSFGRAPDIQSSLQSLTDLRQEWRALAAKSGGAIVEVETRTIDGCEALQAILKMPQQPTGMAYLGSITVPFRDFSYQVNVAAREQGVTGLRDTAVFAEWMQQGDVAWDEGTGKPKGWMHDPYDPSIETPLAWNQSEAETYGAEFIDHPLSRLRSLMVHIEAALKLADEVRAEPRFHPGCRAAEALADAWPAQVANKGERKPPGESPGGLFALAARAEATERRSDTRAHDTGNGAA